MAACQVIQKHGDADVALSKYRIIYGRKPECAQVWNNIGMCFFSKKKFVAAVSCLKRANYLAPFEFFILYNLALVHLYLQQNASAAIFLQSAIRINKKHAQCYALLGVTLSKLKDMDNALRALTYSIKLDPTDLMALLNLAILQVNTGVSQSEIDITLQQFHQYYTQRVNSTTQREIDTSMLDIATKLGVKNAQEMTPSTSIFSPDEDPEIESRETPEELPTVKTKIYDDGRHKQRRTKNPAIISSDTEPVQDEQSNANF
jgi:Bardet-Biedl syndrome 4 protein